MRSRTERRAAGWLAAACGAAALSTAVPGAQPGPAAAAGAPTPADVARAIEILRADPNLATERSISTLRWREDGQRKPRDRSAWLAWIEGFFGWLAVSARVLVWGAGAVLAVLLAAFLVRLFRARGSAGHEAPFAAPTHVRDLDIRPEALPSDIGAAARVLWDRGEHRAALALLYRGLLSRLAHVHRVPIRDSTTEGDCLSLAARHLPPAGRDYASRVVRLWQRAVYGRQQVDTSAVHRLCDDFAAALAAGPPQTPEGAA